MRKLVMMVVVAGMISGSCTSQKRMLRNEYTVLSYNVENLFDTMDDPKVPDEEFLPSAEKKWNEERYQKKLNDLARVISDVNPQDAPEIVGLVEVENRAVLEDLISTQALKNHKYGIIHEESPDYRGIDVAMIYRMDAFTVISHETLPVVFADDPEFKTRDILHVVGKIKDQTVHVFVNHWPSRIGGEDKTEPKRILAAKVLKQKVDEVMALDFKANIVILGDMNDEPVNISLMETLGAQSPETGAKLVNLMMPDDKKGDGTYFYSGNWNMLDNIVVSGQMITGKKLKIENNKGEIYRSEWMIFTNNKGAKTPNRTYVGDKYTGGVSDHFPVYFKMKVK
ncbi:MAG TPA: endonuclease/exonuclease/phosphatase family protein [Prolixibacteraceae bacterium]|nr:endonuclease/exonuclease/phosphatase family protein [Prolixibacteraceae bacterium]